MRFEEVDTGTAAGAVLAHTHLTGRGLSLKKGRLLSEADVAGLVAAGVARVFVARLESADASEDEAARRVAAAVNGGGLSVAPAITGRANLFATARGVLVVDVAGVDAANAVDERLTLATRPAWSVVAAGELVATVKIIPFAVPDSLVERAAAAARAVVRVAPFRPLRAGLVLTTLGAPREAMEAQAAASQRQRLANLGSALVQEARVPHTVAAVAEALGRQLAEGLDLVLVLGASAVVDRADIIPAAIERVGGLVEHLGMPVDPGNLLLLGRCGTVPILGVPGCARSLKRSGFDWVLERLAAGVAVTSRDLMALGAGGLLAESDARPSPRHLGSASRSPPRVAAVLLAAGLGRRMGGVNKLLAEVGGVPLVARAADALLATRASPVHVVLGHQAEAVRAALAGRPVRFVVNPDYEEGLGASLRAGIEAVQAAPGEPVDGALVALGDMPFVQPAHIERLLERFDPTGPFSICVPVHERKRGHPVLWSARHFPQLRALTGDVGARALLEAHADAVLSVPVDDAAIHLDVDTSGMLEAARQRLEGA
jgi:molybdenum cofactor cytidylyltransferase